MRNRSISHKDEKSQGTQDGCLQTFKCDPRGKNMGEFRVQEGRSLLISGIKCPSNENDWPCSGELTITESTQEEAND